MDIKGCNCGGEGKIFIHTLPTNRKEVYYDIYCEKCGIRTPSSRSLSEVLEIWNNVMKSKYKIEFIPYSTEYNTTNSNISFGKTFTIKDNN